MDEKNSHKEVNENKKNSSDFISSRQWACVAILFYVNLINYMDRFTIAGILDEIQAEYGINKGQIGFLQTVFIIAYMLFAPLFGYFGDRYSRRWLMVIGIGLWSLTTMIGSFMQSYTSFAITRGIVGIGEASYSTIAPTIISDLFISERRSKMLGLFYFAIPIGSGLGYIVGAQAAEWGSSWRWGLRVTPFLGLVACLLILAVLCDPERGGNERERAEDSVVDRRSSQTSFVSDEAVSVPDMQPQSTWVQDVKSLAINRSFVYGTLGFTCVSFVAGALSWWGPAYIILALSLHSEEVNKASISLLFGLIAMLAGLVGVSLGVLLTTRLRVVFMRSDPIVCAIGLLLSAPLFCCAILIVNLHTNLAYSLLFFAQVFLNINWSIVADMLLYVVVPTRRSTAEALQILISHLFGDAGSPYLVGIVADKLQPVLYTGNATLTSSGGDTRKSAEFYSLQYALLLIIVVEVIGGILFLLNSIYIVRDKENARVSASVSCSSEIQMSESTEIEGSQRSLSTTASPVNAVI